MVFSNRTRFTGFSRVVIINGRKSKGSYGKKAEAKQRKEGG